jgi:RNA polymerase subunit RPABC4/transcription elongation factor Spt4
MEAILARGVQILVALCAAYVAALWFVLIVWTYRDIESRSKNVVTQVFSTLLSVLFFVPGVLLYMVLRPRETLDSTFQRSLEEEYLLQDLEELPLCPSCQHYIHDDFKICPNCRTALREACPGCARLVDLRWNICPYCGENQNRAAIAPKIERPEERWVARPAAVAIDAPAAPAEELPAAVAAQTAEPEPDHTEPQNENDEPAPAVLTVYHHGQQVATVRPFDRRRTKAAGRRSVNGRDNLAREVDDQSIENEELPGNLVMNGDGD